MELSCSSPTLAAVPAYCRRLSACEARRRSPNLVSFSQNWPQFSSYISSSTKASTSSSLSSFFGVSLPRHRHVDRISSPPKSERSFVVAGIFESFTERAIKSVIFSQREAKALGRDTVLTHHLLLGLIAEDRGPGGFLGSGITIDAAREAVRSLWREGNRNDGDDGGNNTPPQSETSAVNMPFAESTKRVFDAAVEYSRSMRHNFVAPEHLAIGLFAVDDGKANHVLKRLGVDVNYLAAVAIARLHVENAKEGREPNDSARKLSRGNIFPGKIIQARFQEKKKEKEALERFCVDLTTRASKGLIDPVIGRETEIQRIIEILCRRTKSNPILLGEAGVGKTAIAEGLAIKIADGNVPLFLMKKRILSLDVGLLIAGAKERGELELRVTALLKEIKKSGNIILFIDEAHTLIGSGTVGRGGKGSGLDIANLLKPSLGRGAIQCIASTTMDEFRLHFETDKALARRFQPVCVDEPNKEDAVEILLGLREKYETYHKCRYTFEAINAAVYLSERYIPDRYLPDKAIDLIDEAGSRACMEASKRRKENRTSVLSKSPTDYWQEIRAVQAMYDEIKEDGNHNADPTFSSSSFDAEITVIRPEDIAAIASSLTGIPVKKLTSDERMLLVGLDEQLKKRVIGQDEAVAATCRAVKRSRVGINDPDRPIASMLFCGPTGVGKTELSKALAATYFGSESAMLRLDMSEYMERHSVSKLIGSPPGYVGYGEGGTLTEAIRKQPFTVVLLDEIEKAHHDIFNTLLQLLEDGHLTDSQGRRVSFKNALVIMTSNVGSATIANGRYRSFGLFIDEDDTASYDGMKSLLMEELKAYFRPELLNRIDELVVFRPLEKPQMLEILNIMLSEVKQRLASFEIKLEVSEEVKNLICEHGYDKSYGARPLRRAVTRIIEDPLSESLLSGNYKPGDTAVIHLDDSGNPTVTNRSNKRLELSDTTTML